MKVVQELNVQYNTHIVLFMVTLPPFNTPWIHTGLEANAIVL